MHDNPDTVRLDSGWRQRRTADMERRRERVATTIAGILIAGLSLMLYAIAVR